MGNSFNSGGWTIGAANTTGGFPLDGEVAEAFVYDTDLTDEEVAALASGFAPSMVRPDSLLGYVPCIRDEDRSLTDGLTFTPTNSPTVADHHRIIYPPPKRTVWTAAVVPPATTLKDVVSRGVIARAR